MSEQFYCPNCGPITEMREEFFSGGYMCAECEATAIRIPPFVTALQQQIAERDARIATLEAALTEIDGCFEAALVEGWIEALADGDMDRIRDIYHRRIHFVREAVVRAAGIPVGGEG